MPSRNTSPLRTERVQRHWSQRELAERIEVDVSTVKRWERQVSVPGPYFRLKLTALFEKSEDELGLREAHVSPTPPLTEEATHEAQTVLASPVTSSLWTVPYRRNPYFTGRDELLRLLDEHLAAAAQDDLSITRRVALTQPQALTGLGGIGKTQLAVEYAYRAREQGRYTHIFWIHAASEEAILTSLTSLAALLPAFAATNETDQQKLVDAIKQWLEECSERWLLIFDNADDLSLIQPYFPRHGNGSILLTTRAHAVGSLANSIAVEKMGFTEGMTLLLRRAQRLAQSSHDEIKAAENLVVALDHFPLALDQAGAYIEETGCTFDAYLQLYQTHRRALLARRGVQATNYPDSVATTWSLSFEKVKHANPAAAQLLQVCAFLAPDSIPEELLTEGGAYWPEPLRQAVADPLAFDQLLEALLCFSLVKRLAENHQLSLHRLVQVVQVEMLNAEEQRQWVERVVRAVNSVYPRQPREDVNSWAQCRRYLEQVQACAILLQQYQVRLSEAADLLDRAGTYLMVNASYPLAEALYQHALRLREEQLGAHDPDIATSLHNLGSLYWARGKYELSESYLHRALCLREEQLGAQHLETGKTLNNLGLVCCDQGKYELAEAYWQRSLTIKEERLGGHRPETARTLDNLGRLYSEQGKYELAELYYERALAILEEQLGKHHPETALVLDNLGRLAYEEGRYKLAETYYERALAILEEQLGAHHVDTAKTLSNLAELYQDLHAYELAEPYFARALEIQEQRLWANHLDLARTLHGFARFHESQGMLQTATTLYQRALTSREYVYGPHHPKTSATRENLQATLHLLGNEEKEVWQDAKHLEQAEIQR